MLRKSIDKEKVSPFFDSWSSVEQEIESLLSDRKRKIETEMTQGITIYQALLAQCSFGDTQLAPLNNVERLDFVMKNKNSYAAFRQLQELFTEMQKKIASKRAFLEKGRH
ncbi:YpoC family protein [Planococcus beigongshangi]|uniref:YpoC family protein n=1 Tax=Planococcus beigongshangi TaxID=2782536 RepID=UPI0032C41305